MNTKRIVFRFKIHDDKIDEYIRIHKDMPKELAALYKECGIINISCFISGTSVICYQEFDMDVYPHKKHLLEQSKISAEFDKILSPTADKDAIIPDTDYTECFYMQ